jgi:hypothetical protein
MFSKKICFTFSLRRKIDRVTGMRKYEITPASQLYCGGVECNLLFISLWFKKHGRDLVMTGNMVGI